jgi:ParB-like chromosome segregation protein Spo0J
MGLAPIAQVAGEASAAAALHELAGEMKRARDTGRLIQDIPEDQIEAGYLVRDRLVADDDELRVLMDSVRARGQQTPIEVVQLDQGKYGLISGWRRLTALRRLLAETGEARFGTVQAILRQPDTAADAYVAMVEENEIRVGLSYYERARVAAKAVEQGVYDSEKEALLRLFSTASRAKRSKIRSFLTIYHALEDTLNFANAIPERLGLALSKVLDDGQVAALLRDGLALGAPETAEAEAACLEAMLAELTRKEALTGKPEPKDKPQSKSEPTVRATAYRPLPGLYLAHGGTARNQTLTLSGPALTEAFRDRLLAWIKSAG